MTVVCSMASFGSSVQVRHGATCQKSMVPAPPVTIASFGGGGLASGTRSWMRWLPVHLALTPGEAHNNRLCSVLLSALLPQTMLLADRGYDADWIRELARQQGAWAKSICFSPYRYRARNLIERFFNKIEQCRRGATRYDKHAANYLAFVQP